MNKQIKTDNAPSAPAILSQAIESNGFVFVAGQIHNKPDGSLVEGSVKEKLDQIMQNVQAVLEAANTKLANCVSVTMYVTDMRQMPEINEVYAEYFGAVLPARAAICVQALPLGATIEVSVVAAQ
jgi:2-iminobutanoate/2-iminopropanoate deaminase